MGNGRKDLAGPKGDSPCDAADQSRFEDIFLDRAILKDVLADLARPSSHCASGAEGEEALSGRDCGGAPKAKGGGRHRAPEGSSNGRDREVFPSGAAPLDNHDCGGGHGGYDSAPNGADKNVNHLFSPYIQIVRLCRGFPGDRLSHHRNFVFFRTVLSELKPTLAT